MTSPAAKMALEQWSSVLTPWTYFEICGLCKAQNRGARRKAFTGPAAGEVASLPEAASKNNHYALLFKFTVVN
ncbi:hypothetical protein [Companilactobacillus zhachilii]|uniref:hypothetical protein n=1 Tax=Companilactobacillus zhachilii TaxID=2304606 RepID=UPI0040337117